MIGNRIIDNAAVAIASLDRGPVVDGREQAQRHPYEPGSVFGIPGRVSLEWAAWANGVAVRELDFHDTFPAAEYCALHFRVPRAPDDRPEGAHA